MAETRRLLNTASLIVLHPSAAAILCVRHPALRRWVFPGGKIESGETPHDAALREVLEEVGVSVVLADLSDCPNWARDGNLRLPQPLAIIQERLPSGFDTYIDFVFAGVGADVAFKFDHEVSEADWFDAARLALLDTTYPVQQMAASIFKRSDEIRARAGADVFRDQRGDR